MSGRVQDQVEATEQDRLIGTDGSDEPCQGSLHARPQATDHWTTKWKPI